MDIIISEPDHAGQGPTHQEDGSDSLPTGPLQSVLASWPAKLCLKCASMTGTKEGLQALLSPDGYKHHEIVAIQESVKDGCELCSHFPQRFPRFSEKTGAV